MTNEPERRSGRPADGRPADGRPRRREPTAQEAKALAHPLRLKIVRLCAVHELTNKELADRLSSDPATVLYHVRLLVDAGLLSPAPVRTGKKGALEKPYRSTGLSWWLDDPLGKARAMDGATSPDGPAVPDGALPPSAPAVPDGALPPSAPAGDALLAEAPPADAPAAAGNAADLRTFMWDAFGEEFTAAGPDSMAAGARFVLHLTPGEVATLERRLLDVLDEYMATDDERRGRDGRTAYNGLLMLHRLAGF